MGVMRSIGRGIGLAAVGNFNVTTLSTEAFYAVIRSAKVNCGLVGGRLLMFVI